MRRAGKRGFTLLEILVATAVFLVVSALLVSIVSSTSTLWQQGIAHNERRSTAVAVFGRMARDLRPAAMPADLAGSNLFFMINPPGVSTNFSYPQSAFWKAPTATDRSKGDLAIVGYFVQWVNDPEAGGKKPKLCRLLLNPDTNTATTYAKTNIAVWLNDNLLKTNAPATKAGGYAGEVAENVLGVWIQPLDPLKKPITTDGTTNRLAFAPGTFDSSRGYSFAKSSATYFRPSALPSSLEIAIVTVDGRTAKKLSGIEKPGAASTNLWADVNSFMSNLPPYIRQGAQVHSTIIDLASSPL